MHSLKRSLRSSGTVSISIFVALGFPQLNFCESQFLNYFCPHLLICDLVNRFSVNERFFQLGLELFEVSTSEHPDPRMDTF
jgi:hypothetical protein